MSITQIYSLSLHYALPISVTLSPGGQNPLIKAVIEELCPRFVPAGIVIYIGDAEDKFLHLDTKDRKSTRLNSSHLGISYAVFCLKNKKKLLIQIYIISLYI